MAVAPLRRLAAAASLTLALGCGPALPDDAAPNTDDAEAQAGSARVGLSLIGLLSPSYNCDAVVAAFGSAPIAFGYLERTFGDSRACLNRLLDHPRFSAVRVHLFNGPCVRNGRCGSYEVLAGETRDSLNRKLAAGDATLTRRMQAEMVRVRDLLQPHLRPGRRYLISGVLEHDLTDRRAAQRVVDMVRQTFGSSWKVVNSPVSGARGVGADFEEGHGDSPAVTAPCVADLDGTETSDFAGYATRYRGCTLTLGWNSEMNCLKDGEAWSDPRARRNCPTKTSLAPFTRVIQAQH